MVYQHQGGVGNILISVPKVNLVKTIYGEIIAGVFFFSEMQTT